VFFKTFYLRDDFEAHTMDDEPSNVPGATAKPETINTMPGVPMQTKTMNIPPCIGCERYTVVHIEYPD
jgi:hypothetical protein